jgi:hypothetical protein
MRSMLLLLVVAVPSVALAHHHHPHFGHHSSSGVDEVPLVCVQWEPDVADAGVDGGQPCSCEVSPVGDDGGVDAGNALHVGEHCVEYGPAFGCSIGSGVLPLAALLMLRRRRARSV